jgi:TetR/AcrR family transcriptional repressor of nem operon
MPASSATSAHDKIIAAAIDLFRRNGFVATTVDEICAAAGVTKGAFFHHFESKEALAETCLAAWNCQMQGLVSGAPFQALTDPAEKLLGCLDFLICVFENPRVMKSCLAGTTVQEVSETHPTLRDAAQTCFASAEQQLADLLAAACRAKRRKLDAAGLAKLWMATVQGSLVLYKASRDETVIGNNLRQVREYVRMLLED